MTSQSNASDLVEQKYSKAEISHAVETAVRELIEEGKLFGADEIERLRAQLAAAEATNAEWFAVCEENIAKRVAAESQLEAARKALEHAKECLLETMTGRTSKLQSAVSDIDEAIRTLTPGANK